MKYRPIRDFQDRAITFLLASPKNMLALLRLARPEETAGLQANSLERFDSSLVSAQLERFEEDLLYEVSFDGGKRRTRILVLVAHQSRSDVEMEVRLFLAAAGLIGRQRRDLRERGIPPSEHRFSPVEAIVLHTGARPWTARPLAECFDRSTGLGWIPGGFRVTLVDLPAMDRAELLKSEDVFSLLLVLFKEQHFGADTFADALGEVLGRAHSLYGRGRVLREMAWFSYNFAFHRLGRQIGAKIKTVVRGIVGSREERTMGQTMAEYWREKHLLEGRQLQLLELIQRKYPEHQKAAIQKRLEAITDEQGFAVLTERIFQDIGWEAFWLEEESSQEPKS